MIETRETSKGTTLEHRFVDTAFRRFFIPSFLSSLGLALGGMVDCLVVGSKMGESGLTALSLGIPLYMFYNLLSYGFSIGGSIHYSTALGEGKPEEGIRIFNNVLRFLLAIYVVTAALGLMFLPELMNLLGADLEHHPEVYTIAEGYMRAQLIGIPIMFAQGPLYYFVHCDNAPKRAATALVVSNIVDILLNYIFVIRLDMGAEGSVYSTIIGAVFCLIICGSHIVAKQGNLRFRWVAFCLSDLVRSIRTGFASAVQYIYQFITVLMCNQLLLSLGGATAVGAFDVIYNMSLLAVAVSDGIGMTLQPMVSTYRAERDTPAVKRTLSLCARWGGLMALVTAIGLFTLAGPLVGVFGMTGDSNAIGMIALMIYSISVLPAVINQTVVYYAQTVEQESIAFVVQTFRMLIGFVVFAPLLAQLGLDQFWLVFPLSELIAIVAVVVLFCYQKWKKSKRKPILDQIYSTYVQELSILGPTVEQVQETCDSWDCNMQQGYYATLVVEELCAAILEDAVSRNQSDVLIKVTVVRDEDGFTLHLRDNAYEFNPFEVEGGPSELGMSIVKKKAKEFFYRRYQGFNTLVVIL